MIEDIKKCMIGDCQRESVGHMCGLHFDRLFKRLNGSAGPQGAWLAQPAYEISQHLTWMEDEYDLPAEDERHKELVRLVNKFYPTNLK